MLGRKLFLGYFFDQMLFKNYIHEELLINYMNEHLHNTEGEKKTYNCSKDITT